MNLNTSHLMGTSGTVAPRPTDASVSLWAAPMSTTTLGVGGADSLPESSRTVLAPRTSPSSPRRNEE